MPRLAVVVLAAVLLAGCTADDPVAQPTTLPPVTATSPAPPAPSASPIPLPPEAEAADAFGAAAFARHYFEVVNAAYLAGDSAQLRPLADPQCGTCENFAEAADSYSAAGERLTANFLEVVDAAAPAVTGATATADVRVRSPERVVVDLEARVVRTLPAEGPLLFVVSLERDAAAWRVVAVQGTAGGGPT